MSRERCYPLRHNLLAAYPYIRKKVKTIRKWMLDVLPEMLNFSGEIEENDSTSLHYDVHKGVFYVKIPKVNPHEEFKNIDLLTSLLAKRSEAGFAPLIEVIENDSNAKSQECNFTEINFDEAVDESASVATSLDDCMYGFASQKNKNLDFKKDELAEIIEVEDPHRKNKNVRKQEKEALEREKFSDDIYLYQYFHPEELEHLLQLEFYSSNKCAEFSDIEKEKMLQLSNKEYLLTEKAFKKVCFSLIDLMYSYAYNHRITEGENNVESAWNITILSATLSWFDEFSSLKDVIVNCFRRSLCYPLYRNWEFSVKIFEDTQKIISNGKNCIIHCLLEILILFESQDPYYLLNEFYMKDYCTWLQKVDPCVLEFLSASLNKITVSKQDVDLDLEELELAAHIVQEEEADNANASSMKDLADNLNSLGLLESKMQDMLISNSSLDSDDFSDNSADAD